LHTCFRRSEMLDADQCGERNLGLQDADKLALTPSTPVP
jgi:hypothetical protein